jgi:hypothetical protein
MGRNGGSVHNKREKSDFVNNGTSNAHFPLLTDGMNNSGSINVA